MAVKLMVDIFILTNAAGELDSWVKPMVKALKKNIPLSRISLFLTPTQFATGQEAFYAKKLSEIDNVFSAKDFLKFLILGKKKISYQNKGIILFLGGDPLYPLLLQKKTHFKLFAYVEKELKAKKAYTKIFNRSSFGDLMTDSLSSTNVNFNLANFEKKTIKIALMPGSRIAHIKYMAEILKPIAQSLKEKNPKYSFFWKISPFIEVEKFARIVKSPDIAIKTNFDNIDFAITVPGTNTAQLAICGIPMLVLMPTNKPELIPMEGLIDYLGKIPILGKKIKKVFFSLASKKIKYLSLPNILTNSKIVPEFFCEIKTDAIVSFLEKYLSDLQTLAETSKKLKKIMGNSGASFKISLAIKKELENESKNN